MQIRFRPIQAWPGALTPDPQRKDSPFKATFPDTLKLLNLELEMLDAHEVVVELAVVEADIRIDGWPRATARPSHPGVILSFDSRHGDLRYFTDVFANSRVWRKGPDSAGYQDMPGWHANLRAIVLGLEALRKVDRYGITQRGEQYTGWRAITQGSEAPMTPEEAAEFISSASERLQAPAAVLLSFAARAQAYRAAAKRLHPDVGGNQLGFARLLRAKALLDAEGLR